MKRSLLFIALIIGLTAQSQEDYTIEIGDKVLKVELDKQYEVELNNQRVKFTIKTNDTLLFKDDAFSFSYPKGFKVSELNVEVGIDQYMLMTAEGTGIIIQKYSNLNPTMMNELLLNEVTKESLSYGYQLKREDYKRTLRSGETIKVDKAVLTYKDETNIYEITSLGKKDEGIIVMTMVMDKNINEQGEKLIDLMWSSLTYY